MLTARQVSKRIRTIATSKSLSEAGERLGVSKVALSRWLRRNGMDARITGVLR